MLSIIIPTLNEEKCLPLLLESIKKQNFAGDFEIIVADAGSQDKTIEIAKSYGCRITPGGLPAQGRNAGAKIAKGDLFLFMDADNIYLSENFLDQLLGEFRKRNLDLAAFPIYAQGNRFDKFAYKIYHWWTKLTQKFLAHAFSSMLVKREIHERIGGFDEKIRIAEDHAYVRQGAKYGKFGFIETEPVFTSPRRFERDGRLRTYFKYFIAGLHMFFLGEIKSDIYHYRFDKYLKDKEKKI